jgi:hypothetical protein
MKKNNGTATWIWWSLSAWSGSQVILHKFRPRVTTNSLEESATGTTIDTESSPDNCNDTDYSFGVDIEIPVVSS